MTCSPPIRPAIFMPLNTRPGRSTTPIEPGRTVLLWLPWLAPWPLKLWRFIAPAKPLPRLMAVTSTRSPFGQDVGADLLADLEAVDVVEAQLDQVGARPTLALAKWPASGLLSLRASFVP